MDKAELDRLKGLEAGATKGPWMESGALSPVDGEYDWAIGAVVADDSVLRCIAECFGRVAEDERADAAANAAFIAASRSALPELIAENERLESENARLRAGLADIDSWRNDQLGVSSEGSPNPENVGFRRGCRMAFYRCSERARSATGGG